METFLYILYVIIAIGALWVFYLTCDKTCPKCGTKLDKAGNDYHCRNCRILWHMNTFGKIVKENNYENNRRKAKAYDEAYKKVAIRFGSNVADEIFLEESEDEKIRKGINRLKSLRK